VAVALAIYTFLLISRLPELFSFIGVFRPVLLVALLTVALAWTLPRTRLTAVLDAPETRAVLGIYVLVMASIPTSYWPGASLRFAVFNFSKTVLFFFLLLYCIRTFRELRNCVLAFVGSAATLELGTLLFNVKERVRITGMYDPNDLAFVMVCTLPVAIMLLIVERPLWRYAMIPIVPLALVTIIMTKSRGGFIALLAVGAITLGKLPSRVPLLRTGLVVGGVLVFALLAPQSYWDRITTIWGEDEPQVEAQIQSSGAPGHVEYVQQGFSTRWRLWLTGLQLMLEHPILGVGASAFAMAEHGQTFEKGSGLHGWKGAHNSFTQVGAELGILGLVLFVYLLYRTIRNYRMVIRVAGPVPQLRYQLWAAHGLEAATYGYIIAGAAINQGYSAILYYLVAMSMLMKWGVLRDRAQLDNEVSSQAPLGSLPWWRAPR
jgi:O-antigen ligase